MNIIQTQKTKRIAYLGPQDTYSHIAAEKNCQFMGIKEYDMIECATMGEVILKVQNDEADYGYAPYWNTCKHRIVEAQIGLIQAEELCVVDNFKMDINIFLVSRANALNEVRELHTIPHVIKQFSKYQSEKLKDLVFKEMSSTVKGVQSILKHPYAAAVCSRRAADNHSQELNILDRNIQNPKNGTLFFVFKKISSLERICSENYSLLAFPLLKQFKTRLEVTNLLLDKLVFLTNEWTILIGQSKWAFMEVKGHIDDVEIRELVDGLIEIAGQCRVVGCYETRIEQLWDGPCRFDSL